MMNKTKKEMQMEIELLTKINRELEAALKRSPCHNCEKIQAKTLFFTSKRAS